MALGIKFRTNIPCPITQKKFPMLNREMEEVKWEKERGRRGEREKGRAGDSDQTVRSTDH
jgi:hypothetical protein